MKKGQAWQAGECLLGVHPELTAASHSIWVCSESSVIVNIPHPFSSESDASFLKITSKIGVGVHILPEACRLLASVCHLCGRAVTLCF